MRFSVIIPLFNKAPYVKKAIESVLEQTWRDYELVVIDDGSSDDSFSIAQETLKDSPAKYHLIRQVNSGVSTARNNGVSISHGDYICFLDADDWWEPTFLEEMDSLINDFPDAGLYGTSYTVVNNEKQKTRIASIGVADGFQRGYFDYFQAYINSFYMPIWTGAACMPRAVFDSVHGFNPQLKMSEDFDLWVRIAMKYKVALQNSPLSNYNQDVGLSNRAIGTLPPPETQFAFQADYLAEAKKDNPVLKYTVEMVQISCLRSYYLSKKYHEKTKAVLATLDLGAHRNKAYASYLYHPYYLTVFKDWLFRILRRWINK